MLPEPVDTILIVNTYHHLDHRVAYFQRVRSFLRPGGKLVIVDFKKGELPVGPSDDIKLAPEIPKTELDQAGYQLERQEEKLLPYQYVLVFQPRG